MSKTNVPDYDKFVPSSKAMWLDRIHKRASSSAYGTGECQG